MRQPIASKLAELREAIGRIPPHKTPRKGFTKAQRKAVVDAYDGRCAGCDEDLLPGFEIDHVLCLALGGKHEMRNFAPLCGQSQNGCHVAKTRDDIHRIAAANRIRKREVEGPAPSQIHSRNQWPSGQKIPAHVDPWGKRRRA